MKYICLMHLLLPSLSLSAHCHFQPKVKSTIIYPKVSTHLSDEHHDFCTVKPVSSEEALEERQLLDSIAWPGTPLLSDPLSLEQTTDPAHSTFTILQGRKGGEWHVGDQLEVKIKMNDFQGSPKKSGGDVLLARIHNPTLGAGVAGRVVDHLNGYYTAVFSLLWEGSAQVEVMLKTDVKGTIPPKMKILMESQVKFLSSLNISGAKHNYNR